MLPTNKRYNIIYADPPWTYKDKASAGFRGAYYKYPLMSLADIKAMNVNDIAAANTVLFLWATMPLLAEALAVMAAWGFTYKTCAFT
jgi:N6-adenosine-specific RNA methylase IME4